MNRPRSEMPPDEADSVVADLVTGSAAVASKDAAEEPDLPVAVIWLPNPDCVHGWEPWSVKRRKDQPKPGRRLGF